MSHSSDKTPREEKRHFNPTMDDATNSSPFMQYMQCVDDERRPADHVGDWPKAGTVYPVMVLDSKMEGEPVIHVLGFEGEKPYYNTFNARRFRPIVSVCLN